MGRKPKGDCRQRAWVAKVCDPADVDKRMAALGYSVRGEGLIALLDKAEKEEQRQP